MPRGSPPPGSNGNHPPAPVGPLNPTQPELSFVFGISPRMHAELIEGTGGHPLVGRRKIIGACGWPMQGEIIRTGSVCSPPPLLDEIEYIRGWRSRLTSCPELQRPADPGRKKAAAPAAAATDTNGNGNSNGRTPKPARGHRVQIVDSFRAPSKLFGAADLNPGLSGLTGL